jgi:hypothetical protein
MTSPSSRRAGVVQGPQHAATGPEPSSGVGPAFHLGEPEPPLRRYLELGALPTAVPCARLHARHVLREWGSNGLAPDSELLVSALEALSPARSGGGGGNHCSFGQIDQQKWVRRDSVAGGQPVDAGLPVHASGAVTDAVRAGPDQAVLRAPATSRPGPAPSRRPAIRPQAPRLAPDQHLARLNRLLRPCSGPYLVVRARL